MNRRTANTIDLIIALRISSDNIKHGAPYQWGHMGSCNCGNLAQVLTGLSKGDIHSAAMNKSGDWTEQVLDHCPQSGLPMDLIIDELYAKGLTKQDLVHLERLSDPLILKRIGVNSLHHNYRDDVVLYMKTWASLLEEELLTNIKIPREELSVLVH